jgi:hypothetical protein
MPERATLEHLCERYGIAAGYEDAWGASRQTPEETKLALLRAMGIDVAAAANDASGADSDAGASGGPAPAIVVDDALANALQLRPSSALPFSVSWRIDRNRRSLEGPRRGLGAAATVGARSRSRCRRPVGITH